jgi:Tol biopolymer transport system component
MLAMATATGSAEATFPGTNGEIAFVRENSTPMSGIFVVGPEGQDPHEIAPGPGVADVVPAPSFSADGERIVFSFYAAGDDDIFAMDADGTNQVRLTDNAVEDSFPGFSPNGQKIVFTTRIGGADLEIALMDADGQNIVPLTENGVNDTQPSFSPDGSRIVFRRSEPGDDEIFVMNADGGDQHALTVNSVPDIAPGWAPDGQKIVFARGTGAPRQIFVMDADGANQTPLTNTSANDLWPSFSPDGQKIVFVRFTGGPADLMIMPASGGDAVPLFESPAVDFWTNWQPLNPPKCDLSGAAKQKSPKRVTVTVNCSENATVAASGELKAPQPKLGAAGSKSKLVTLDPVTTQVGAGTPTTITLATPKKGRRLLKKALKAGKKPKGSVAITATDDLGATGDDSFAVKLKPKKK